MSLILAAVVWCGPKLCVPNEQFIALTFIDQSGSLDRTKRRHEGGHDDTQPISTPERL
jgi:hypothetical protein